MENLINTIIKGNCVEELKKLPSNSIDLIFADPPYNLQLGEKLIRPDSTEYSGVEDKWDKFSSNQEYEDFCTEWLGECKRILKDNGSIWVIGSYHNVFTLGYIMQSKLNLWFINDIIWIKHNPTPNFNGTRFNNAHETLIWATKSKESKFTFHYKSMKSFNDDKQMRSDWYLPICQGGERLKDENNVKVHSTQKPEDLLYRIILSNSNEGDIILDPFFGTGTTGAVAKKLNRNFIGIEQEDKYIKYAKERIEIIQPLDLETLEYKIEIKESKVSIGQLIESELLSPGTCLYDKNKTYKAILLADGTLDDSQFVGSIHKLSARRLGKTNNNGWEYWYFYKDGTFTSINELRKIYNQKYR